MPVLWSFRRCPYAMRARLAIKSSGMPVRLREILLRDKPEEFLVDSEKGTVPVLKFQDGNIIDESLDVINWALTNNDPEDWLRVCRESPGFCHEFVQKLDGPFKHSLDRYKYATRYDNGLEDEAIHRDLGAALFEISILGFRIKPIYQGAILDSLMQSVCRLLDNFVLPIRIGLICKIGSAYTSG